MTHKKQWYFGPMDNGNIIATSGRYGLVEIKETIPLPLPIVTEPVIAIPVKLSWWQKLIIFLKGIFK